MFSTEIKLTFVGFSLTRRQEDFIEMFDEKNLLSHLHIDLSELNDEN